MSPGTLAAPRDHFVTVTLSGSRQIAAGDTGATILDGSSYSHGMHPPRPPGDRWNVLSCRVFIKRSGWTNEMRDIGRGITSKKERESERKK